VDLDSVGSRERARLGYAQRDLVDELTREVGEPSFVSAVGGRHEDVGRDIGRRNDEDHAITSDAHRARNAIDASDDLRLVISVERVDVRAPAVACAEEQTTVAGEHRWHTGIRGAADHHVAVERRQELGRCAAVGGNLEQARMSGADAFLSAEDDRCAVRSEHGRHGGSLPVRDLLWFAALRAHDVQAGAGRDVTIGRRPGERDARAVRGPCRSRRVEVVLRELLRLARRCVDDVQMHALRADESSAVGFEPRCADDDRRVLASLLVFVGLGFAFDVHGCEHGEPRAVGSPDESAGAQRQIGELASLTAGRREQPDLRGSVGGTAEERQLGSVGGPTGVRVVGAPRELGGLAGVARDRPDRALVLVGVAVHGGRDEGHAAPVRVKARVGGLAHAIEVLQDERTLSHSHSYPRSGPRSLSARTSRSRAFCRILRRKGSSGMRGS
jgi:hypothetical protein